MKQKLFLCIVCLFVALCSCGIVCAQSDTVGKPQGDAPRRVVVNVVDEQSSLPSAIKTIMQTSLTKALTEQPGYVVLDRPRYDTGAGQMELSGNLSDQQQYALGKMMAADYILVVEAVGEQGQIMLMAKMLDMETGAIVRMANAITETAPASIMKECQEVVNNICKRPDNK